MFRGADLRMDYYLVVVRIRSFFVSKFVDEIDFSHKKYVLEVDCRGMF